MQLENRIGQRIGHVRLGQGRSNPAHDHLFASSPGDDEAADHDVVAGSYARPRGGVEVRGSYGADLEDLAAPPLGEIVKAAIGSHRQTDRSVYAGSEIGR